MNQKELEAILILEQAAMELNACHYNLAEELFDKAFSILGSMV